MCWKPWAPSYHSRRSRPPKSIHKVGIAFLFAPAYHPAMRFAVGPRRELASRTVFNVLGPLTNPAPTTHQLVGVFSSGLLEFMAGVLRNMGSRGAYVVHGRYETGAGLDELTTTGLCQIAHLHDGAIDLSSLDPADIGFPRATLADLQGGDAAANAAIARSILAGEIAGPKLDVVLLNAGAALGLLSGDVEAGIADARRSVTSGAALDCLDRYVAQTRAFASAG